eukprot:809853-Pleurochrysis_carterae.AAC.1
MRSLQCARSSLPTSPRARPSTASPLFPSAEAPPPEPEGTLTDGGCAADAPTPLPQRSSNHSAHARAAAPALSSTPLLPSLAAESAPTAAAMSRSAAVHWPAFRLPSAAMPASACQSATLNAQSSACGAPESPESASNSTKTCSGEQHMSASYSMPETCATMAGSPSCVRSSVSADDADDADDSAAMRSAAVAHCEAFVGALRARFHSARSLSAPAAASAATEVSDTACAACDGSRRNRSAMAAACVSSELGMRTTRTSSLSTLIGGRPPWWQTHSDAKLSRCSLFGPPGLGSDSRKSDVSACRAHAAVAAAPLKFTTLVEAPSTAFALSPPLDSARAA